MINDFDDFCLWTYVVVDELWQRLGPLFRRPGPAPVCSDSELLTLALMGECRGWDVETELLSHWQAHRARFPCLPSQSRFNRRRRQLADAFNLLRRAILGLLGAAADRHCVLDSLPVPALAFHLVPGSAAIPAWKAAGAAFSKHPHAGTRTKKQTIFGYKLPLLLTLGGVILDFELAPANAADLTVGAELLAEHADLDALGDKAYISAVAADVLTQQHIVLLTVPRRNQQQQLPAAVAHLLNGARQIIETVTSQLDGQFHVETNHAHTFHGLCARLYTKLTAPTLCLYVNRLLGKADIR